VSCWNNLAFFYFSFDFSSSSIYTYDHNFERSELLEQPCVFYFSFISLLFLPYIHMAIKKKKKKKKLFIY
jgi:hypothetical protein